MSHSGSEHSRFLHFLSTGPPERQERQSSPPRRAGRYRVGEGGDNDEFLRMFGITPDEQPKSKQAETWDDEKWVEFNFKLADQINSFNLLEKTKQNKLTYSRGH